MNKILNKSFALMICLDFIFPRYFSIDILAETPWLSGASPFDLNVIDNSVVYGAGQFGNSTINDLNADDIDIYFSEHPDSVTYCSFYNALSLDSEYLGIGTFPGTVWDVSEPHNPRRLNVIVYEREDGSNLYWDPDENNSFEFFIIMKSNYDNNGLTYSNIFNPTPTYDAQYMFWLEVNDQYTWFESDAYLKLRNYWDFAYFDIIAGDEQLHLYWAHEEPEFEAQQISSYILYWNMFQFFLSE